MKLKWIVDENRYKRIQVYDHNEENEDTCHDVDVLAEHDCQCAGEMVGIVDGGLDVSHPSFFSTDGTTYRVKRFVDDYTEAGETIGKDKGSDPLCAKKAKQVVLV